MVAPRACRLQTVHMGPKSTSPVGSGMSRHTRRSDFLDADDQDFPDRVREFFDGLDRRTRQPWSVITPAVNQIRGRWEKVRSELPDPETDFDQYRQHFVERETEAWYLRTASLLIGAAEQAVEKGQYGEALRFAYELGDLMCEYHLKLEWEPIAVEGKRARDARALGASNRRKSSAATRIASVSRHLEAGATKVQAYERAAAELGCSPSAVKRDYLIQKKVGPTSG